MISLTAVKECRDGEREGDDGSGVKEEEDEEDEPIGVVEHSGALLPLDADEHDNDDECDRGRAHRVDEPGDPVHPVRQPHHLHQLRHPRRLLLHDASRQRDEQDGEAEPQEARQHRPHDRADVVLQVSGEGHGLERGHLRAFSRIQIVERRN